jgi:hypothetical protein
MCTNPNSVRRVVRRRTLLSYPTISKSLKFLTKSAGPVIASSGYEPRDRLPAATEPLANPTVMEGRGNALETTAGVAALGEVMQLLRELNGEVRPLTWWLAPICKPNMPIAS